MITNLNKKVENSFEIFMLAAEKCGFNTEVEIKENFEIICVVALSMVESSRDKIITTIATNEHLVLLKASEYKQKVNNN